MNINWDYSRSWEKLFEEMVLELTFCLFFLFSYATFSTAKMLTFEEAVLRILQKSFNFNFYIFINVWLVSEVVAHSCLTFCDPMDCSLPRSSVHEIFQARVLEWVVISFSRGSSWPRDQTWVSHIVGRCFTIWATREVLMYDYPKIKL